MMASFFDEVNNMIYSTLMTIYSRDMFGKL